MGTAASPVRSTFVAARGQQDAQACGRADRGRFEKIANNATEARTAGHSVSLEALMQRGNVRSGTLVLAAMAGLAAGCAAGSDPSSNRATPTPTPRPSTSAAGSGESGSASVDNPSGSAAGSSAKNTAGTGTVAEAGIVDAAVTDAPLTSANSCGKGKAEAKLKPVNMFVMFDRSGSMEDDNKWTDASAALTAFFQDPGVSGMRVALRFFPHDSPADGCTKDGCDPVACSQPLVPLGTLTAEAAPIDSQENALVRAVANSAPGGGGGGGGTPIHAALDGALRWATSYQAMHTDETTVVVFVTDGEPNGCNENFNDISTLAAKALMTHGVTTYAIGLVGSSTSQMDQLAQAGGTKKGIFIGTGATAEQELISALNAIRGQALSCDFPMPQPTDPSMMIDPTKVNLTFTPGTGMPGTLAQVHDESACGTNKSWYYDMPQQPSVIHLCPAACDLVRNDPKAMLELLLGCATACGGLDVNCGGAPPPADVPPILL
jgi:Mg-chelatase subunit ChlD